jgi:hypothetical protein
LCALVNLAVAGLVALKHLYFNAAFNLAAAFFIFGLYYTNRRLDRAIRERREQMQAALEEMTAMETAVLNEQLLNRDMFAEIRTNQAKTAEERAQAYLAHICKLTGAKVESWGVSFMVKDVRYGVKTSGAYRGWDDSTCLRIPRQKMPGDEILANSLLQLYANPKLFEKWCGQTYRYKPDGTPLDD